MNENDPTDPGPIPAALDRNANMSAKQKKEAKERIDEIIARERAAVPVMPKASIQKSPLAAAQAETRKEKSRVRVEKMLAKKTGETTKMPATGSAALAIIRADKPKETNVRTEVKSPDKLPIPPRRTNKSVVTAKKTKAKPQLAKLMEQEGKAAAKRAKPKAKAKATNGKSKVELIGELLLRAGGCTMKDILDATEAADGVRWPSVSVPQQARAAGLKLKKEKVEGQPTRYYGRKA